MLEDLTYWHWFILAALLIVVELLAPGAFFLWLGIAASIVGASLLIINDLTWENQFIIFSISSVLSIVIWWKYFKGSTEETDQPLLNRRGEHYIGRTFTLEEAMVDGMGKIRVDDSTWKIKGNDCPAGSKVSVTAVEGTILVVECL